MALLTDFEEAIKNAKTISIHSHIVPDADAFGSVLSLKKFLLSMPGNKFSDVDIFIDTDEIAKLYVPMVNGTIINPCPKEKYELSIALDSPNILRFGRYGQIYQNAKTKINIDHHTSNENYGDINIISEKTSSTCEMLYFIFKKLNPQLITKDIATLLFCGILTDTSCLSQGSITPNTYSTIKEIVGKEVNDQALREYFFKSFSKAKAKISAKATQTTMFFNNDKIALMLIKNSDLIDAGASFEDTLGIVDTISNIKCVDIAIVLIEKEPNSYHVSLRSRGEKDVLQIAQDLGGGGNTKNMAAFQFNGDLSDLKHSVLIKAKDEISKHSQIEEVVVDPFNFND